MAAAQDEVQWLSAALAQTLQHGVAPAAEQRRAAEAALVQWQHSDAAWGTCLRVLSSAAPSSTASSQDDGTLLLFAAQTLRLKLNETGSALAAPHLEQLKQALLHQLLTPQLPTPLLRQLCLAVATVAALLPSWTGWLGPVCSALPWRNAVQLLNDVAEDGCSSWRHVATPGLTSSEKLSWATATRDRFRGWSEEALQLLHTWLQQQQQQQQQSQHAIVALLHSLTSWVRLGCLHHVSQQLGEATAHVGLAHIQSPHEEVVSAALALLTELPEFSPEQLLKALEPHMLQVAAAAAQTPNLMHAAAWTGAFAAHAAAVPRRLLLAEGEDEAGSGQDMREALLQVAALPQLHSMQPICLPALRVWSSVLGHDSSPASAAAFAAAGGGGSGGLSRASTAAADADTPTAAALAAALAADAGGGAPCERHGVPGCVVAACHRLLLQTACNCMLWALESASEGQDADAAAGLEAAAAVHDLFLAVCCVIGQQEYLQGVLLVSGGQQQQVVQQQQQQQQPVRPPWWQQAECQQVVQRIASAPSRLRLKVAVEMAAAAVVQPLCTDEGGGVEHQACSSSITSLLSHAASHVAQTPAPGNQQHAQLALAFCRAVQVWSDYLASHLAGSAGPEGAASMGSLLQLLVALTADPGAVRTAAASAVRALTCSALHLGWDNLHLAAPLLLQVVQPLTGFDIADQDLFASLSMCLAAVGAPQKELHELRATSCAQLVQPVVQHLDALLQQLQAGQQWQAIAKPADVLLCQHMVRVRVVLEAAWQRHEQQRRAQLLSASASQHDHPSNTHATTAAAAAGASGMDEDTEAEQFGLQQRGAAGAAGPALQQQHDVGSDPAVQLVCSQLLGQLHALVIQHAAGGKFLQHHARCFAKLLKLQPELLLKPQQRLAQFVEVCVLGVVRPGGGGMAEALLAAIELCCRQQGAELLLEAAPCINQAFATLWSLPEALSLQQPGHGDAAPDITDAVLKLSSSFVGHSSLLKPSSSQLAAVVPSIAAAAAACARCCHKKVGSHALATLLALLGAATAAAGAESEQQLQEAVASLGAVIAAGALGALLVPSPLPRLQKVSSLLLELATLAHQVGGQQQAVHPGVDLGSPAAAAAAGGGGGNPQQQGVLHGWLLQAAQGLPLTAAEAAELAAACAGLLGAAPNTTQQQHAGARSFVAARRLKKKLRDVAERHMRMCSTAGAQTH